ncbi:MAG: thiol-disulfide oxidoreductase DCC family protein [Saccharospirillum sp.]
MTEQRQKAPVTPESRVVLFDGVCRLCSAWARFLIKFDKKRRFKLATVQSPQGQALLQEHGFPVDTFETMILVEGSRVYTQSTAFFQVMRRLPFPWPVGCVGWIVPRVLRDWLYDRIALNRYRLFGRYDACVLPAKDHESRFLSD